MPQYLIYFNQQWVGDHDEAWFESRVEPSTAVVRDMQDQSVLVYAGGLVEELEEAASADATSGELVFTDGPFAETKEWLGGLTIVDVPDDESARMWAGRVAEGCGWPQEVRRFKAGSLQALVLGGEALGQRRAESSRAALTSACWCVRWPSAGPKLRESSGSRVGYEFLHWFKRACGARARCGRRSAPSSRTRPGTARTPAST